MNFLELIKERHSVRHYAQQVVEKRKAGLHFGLCSFGSFSS